MKKKNYIKSIPTISSVPIVLTLDLPWEYVSSDKPKQKLIEIAETLKNIPSIHNKQQTIDQYMGTQGFEFYANNTIPKKYIKSFEKIDAGTGIHSLF